MTPKEEAQDLIDKMTMEIGKFNAKQCALIAVNEIIKYHESLFDKGFKDIHIALSSPIKTYLDIMNPLLKHLIEVREELKNLPA